MGTPVDLDVGGPPKPGEDLRRQGADHGRAGGPLEGNRFQPSRKTVHHGEQEGVAVGATW